MDGLVRRHRTAPNHTIIPGYPPEDERTLRILQNINKSALEMSEEDASELWDYLTAKEAFAG
ncbi:MAG: hypothetical protein KDK37_15470 [Leptospiraceae bacterium]|nr:hypothetical protein [Leptospiraceae bacterium]